MQRLSRFFSVGFKMGNYDRVPNFVGHMVPGTLFTFLGLWWTFNIWSSYFSALHSRRRFQSTVSFPLRQGSRVPWESIISIVLTTAAIAGERLDFVLGGLTRRT